MNPSDRLQRILDVLDQPTQSAGDVAYEFSDPTLCWRCEIKDVDSQAAGLCAKCHEQLISDRAEQTLDVDQLKRRLSDVLGRPPHDFEWRWLWGLVSQYEARAFLEVGGA